MRFETDQQERMLRKKIIESAQTGMTYYVEIETDLTLNYHAVTIYDENPDAEPLEVKILGILPIKLDPPPVEPIIQRTYPLHADLKQKIAELIWRHELPMVRLYELDEWDGVVRPPQRQPELEREPVEESGTIPEPEPEGEPENNILRIRDWKVPGTMYYDRSTGRMWVEGEDEDVEDTENTEEAV